MDEIISKCKCGVYLEVNRYRDYYISIEEAIKDINSIATEQEIDDELSARMIAEDSLVSLQFYPNTPIGFYKVYGTALDEVVEKAKECLNEN